MRGIHGFFIVSIGTAEIFERPNGIRALSLSLCILAYGFQSTAGTSGGRITRMSSGYLRGVVCIMNRLMN